MADNPIAPVETPDDSLMKSGWQTSEFWVTISSKVLALLCVAGVLKSADEQKMSTTITEGIIGVFAIIAAARVVVEYIKGRVAVKTNGNGGKPK